MKHSKKFFTFVILFSIVLMFSMITVTAAVVSEPQKFTTNQDNIQIETKYKKVSTYKIIFDGNGGKIGSKTSVTMSIHKGSKIKKFPAIPKRKGYIFQGWFTKKKGGKEITKNTKPGKSVTYFAQWKKGSTSTSSKLVGHWRYKGVDLSPGAYDRPAHKRFYYYDYFFYKDGKFKYFYTYDESLVVSGTTLTEGKYKVSNGKVYFTSILYERGNPIFEKRYKDTVFEYKIGKDNVGEYLSMPRFQYDVPYLDTSYGLKFRRY